MNQKQPNVLVTGGNGQLGNELKVLARASENLSFKFVDIEELDICSEEAVIEFFANNEFDSCINCAAYTAVDKAESESDAAWRVNVKGALHLATNCRQAGIPFITISTDYVYHTSQNTPYKETDAVDPQGVYAQSKLEGDIVTLKNGGMVIRTSWLYSSFGNNFVKTILKLSAERKELGIVCDQIGTPTYAKDLAEAMFRILGAYHSGEVERSLLEGVYHYSNEGVCSWYDLAVAICELAGREVTINPINTADYPTAAKRPPYSVLDKSKIKSAFGLKIPHWQSSLIKCLELLKHQ